jgi:hypothetical protein
MFKMTLKYWVIVEMFPVSNDVIGSSLLAAKSSLYLIGKKNKKKKKKR